MRHDVVLRFVVMTLFCFTLTGCIHYEHKSAEGKTWAEVATIRQFDKHLSIDKIDDDTSLYWLARQTEYRLGAGKHKLSVKYSIGTGYSRPIEMTVDLVGGRTYGLYGISSMKWWYYEVRDVDTGRSAKVIEPAVTTTPSESAGQAVQ
ncbi:hypothetical protein B1219_04130 [Pseudomonas ogarae]|uniref:hypothetical protein n=1 Tax=Pseudomonas ogarae (strain DSM 112162 / CECT 30235 / F113) TaxID=1114970 RepID=UPI0009A39891|nr:hypothetical protein [Pseudomonas ogarae]OPG74268.1 hypothetical protein B1219_04130 [Pseudomonas ogarae]OPG80168.1 hypothetical protein B1218_06600 [Pseudomonas ogarae]PBJ12971.1 hypothetical protein BSF43_19260 [Pseudomonas ogarae]